MTASTLSHVATYELVDELADRDQLALAVRELRRRNPWWHRFKIGNFIWGLSSRWLAVCPWNGDESWIQIPLVCLIVGTKHIEVVLGAGKWTLNIDVRWRFD